MGRVTIQDEGARVDPRVLRTRRLLQDALLSLARERSLDEISVADVADRATVNRSTFYQHYPDTDTLLADALDAQATLVGADLTQIHPGVGTRTPPDVLVRYATHVAENVSLYRSALGEHGSPVAVTRLRRRIAALATEGLELHGAPPGPVRACPCRSPRPRSQGRSSACSSPGWSATRCPPRRTWRPGPGRQSAAGPTEA